jgi:hypothetical protein
MIENKKKIVPNNQEVTSKSIESKNISIPFEKKLFISLRNGLFAFSIVLILLSFSKLLAFSTGSISGFFIGTNDLVYSFWASFIVTSIEIISYRKS